MLVTSDQMLFIEMRDTERELNRAVERGHPSVIMCDCGESFPNHEFINGKWLCFPDDFPEQEFTPVGCYGPVN